MRATLLAALLVALTGCGSDEDEPPSVLGYDALAPVVREELVLFSGSEIPAELVSSAEERRILMLGETHYMQEHHELVARLFEPLHARGYRTVMFELPQAEQWRVQRYVQGGSDSLPDMPRRAFGLCLDTLRELNLTLTPDMRYDVVFMDVNHRLEYFTDSLAALAQRLGDPEVLRGIAASQTTSSAYRQALLGLRDDLAVNRGTYASDWGEDGYARVVQLIEVEIPSAEFRTSRDFAVREGVMLDNIRAALAAQPDAGSIVTCGSAHASKTTLGDLPFTNTGEILADEHGDALFSVAFQPVSGQLRRSWGDPRTLDVDVIANTARHNLLRIVAVEAGDSMAVLPFTHPAFKEDILVDSGLGDRVAGPPAEMFDALVTYPRVTVLESL